jgi:hypothetical protein
MKKSRRETDAISEEGTRKTGRFGNIGFLLFSSPFLLAGAALIYFLGLGPALKIIRASTWDATPCVVISSRVASSSDGDTFAVEIHYTYTVDGKQYQGTRYGFFGGYSSGYDSKDEVVKENPAGKPATCYVNPSDPAEAVFHRGVSWEMLWGLFGLPFLAVGLAGPFMAVRSSLRQRRLRKQSQANPLSWPKFEAVHSPVPLSATQGGASFDPHPAPLVYPSPNLLTSVPIGGVVLEPAMTPARRLIIMTIFAVFWNGIVSVFVGVLLKQWGRGNFEWMLALFLTPFVLIGLLLLFGVAHGFLALFNPRPRLTIASRQLALGESADLEWEFSGATRRVKQLHIYLEGREEATYRRGTDTSTDKNVFSTIEIARKTHAEPGRALVEIPGNTMHSFNSEHNKIVWEIHVKGEIGYWSDVDETFEIEVLPRQSFGIVEP